MRKLAVVSALVALTLPVAAHAEHASTPKCCLEQGAAPCCKDVEGASHEGHDHDMAGSVVAALDKIEAERAQAPQASGGAAATSAVVKPLANEPAEVPSVGNGKIVLLDVAKLALSLGS